MEIETTTNKLVSHPQRSLPDAFIASAVILLLTLVTAARAQNLTVIYNFTGQNDGYRPYQGVIVDKMGNLWGTAIGGGANGGQGSVFKMSQRNSTWNFSILYTFSAAGTDGANPNGLTRAANGILYGTTMFGGVSDSSFGTVFELRPSASAPTSVTAPWLDTVLHSFDGPPDGWIPYGNPVIDAQGNLYGTSTTGGNSGNGLVWKLTPTASGWTEDIVYEFYGNSDGASPMGNLVMDNAGNVYGTAQSGGLNYCGSVFKLAPQGSGYTYSTIYAFTGNGDGCFPQAGVILDSFGNLFGATTTDNVYPSGVVFELSPNGNNWTYNLVHAFAQQQHPNYYDCIISGFGPVGNLTLDSAGNLYGTTEADGAQGLGNVFELSPTTNGWTYASLYDFSGNDGQTPCCAVSFDAHGNMYGTTINGGSGGWGTVWELTR